jgi:hypothetical protein
VAAVTGLYRGAFPGRFTATTVTLTDATALGVVGLYVPSRGPQRQRNVAKRRFQDEVLAALPLEHPGGRCCVADPRDMPSPFRVRGQIVWASSVNAAATLWAGGTSTASSEGEQRRQP